MLTIQFGELKTKDVLRFLNDSMLDNAAIKKFLLFVRKRKAQKKGPFKFTKALFNSLEQQLATIKLVIAIKNSLSTGFREYCSN